MKERKYKLYNLNNYGFSHKERIMVGITTALSTIALILSIYAYRLKDYEIKTMQINKVEDRDNIPGYDTIISQDGRTFKIEERNGKLSLLEKSLEKAE